jgi:dipeptidase E
MDVTRRQLLLISTSTTYGSGYLDHAAADIQALLGRSQEVLFVPFALKDLDAYASKARERFATLGYGLASLHGVASPEQAIERAGAIFIGGGNTFRLLWHLYRLRVIHAVRRRVAEGMLYIGASAGSNVAGPTIKTTNDMPIVQPPSFDALGLVPFQINPHYLDPDPGSTHMGETREQRIREFHEENATAVVGLREGAMLRVDGPRIVVRGPRGARIFRQGREPIEASPGDFIEDLVT